MARGRTRILIAASLAVSLLIALGLLLGRTDGPLLAVEGPAQGIDGAGPFSPAIQSSEPTTVYLPLVGRNFPPPPPQFGVQMHAITDSHGLTRAVEGNVHWVRFNAFPWDQIEPVRTDPPTYNWDAVDEESLRNAAESGMTVIGVVKFTPEWAQKYSGSYCGPIRDDALDEFAQFMGELVSRYSAPPYNVRYWELGNEPDAAVIYNRRAFGCWGEEGEPYYGGQYYAEMLRAAYPAIKAADSQSQVLIGGLLLYCDPTNPPEGEDCLPSRFLEGILVNGGGDYFDIVSFHGYPFYDGTLQMDEHFPSWEARGGVVLGKVDFLEEVMASYGVDKPLILTEGALTCPEWSSLCNPPGSDFYEAQADYVVWLFVRNWANGLLGTTWYTLEGPGYRYSGLLDADQEPRPAYDAFAFLTDELDGASYTDAVTQHPALRGYEFMASGKRIWVLWAPDEQPHTITLPAGVLGVYDKYGNDITPTGDELEVNHPVYVEISP